MENQVVFKELEVGNYFNCKPTTDAWALQNGLTHEYENNHGGICFVRPLKTVAYVAVDESAEGTAVLEKWRIRVVQ